METNILDGKYYAAQFKEETKAKIAAFEAQYNIKPGLAVIIVGENPASKVYVNNKHRTCTEMGIYSEVISLAADIEKDELIAEIHKLNQRTDIHGILVQLPLPDKISKYELEILEAINPLKDVDGFHPMNIGKLMLGEDTLVPCTPYGCIKLLQKANIELEGANAVIIGRSNIVGKPMAQLLLKHNATVTVCHSRTRNLAEVCRRADILVVAIGKPQFVTADMVKPGATVIDVGINRLENKKLVGDVDFEAVKDVAGAITPVPGGVGLLTIAMLMENTLKAALLQMAVK